MKGVNVNSALKNCAKQISGCIKKENGTNSAEGDLEFVLIALPWKVPTSALDGLTVEADGGVVRLPAGQTCSVSVHHGTSRGRKTKKKGRNEELDGEDGEAGAGGEGGRRVASSSSALSQYFAGLVSLPSHHSSDSGSDDSDAQSDDSDDDSDDDNDDDDDDDDNNSSSSSSGSDKRVRAVKGKKFAQCFSHHFRFSECPVPSLLHGEGRTGAEKKLKGGEKGKKTKKGKDVVEKRGAPEDLLRLGVSGYPFTSIPQLAGLRQRFTPAGGSAPTRVGKHHEKKPEKKRGRKEGKRKGKDNDKGKGEDRKGKRKRRRAKKGKGNNEEEDGEEGEKAKGEEEERGNGNSSVAQRAAKRRRRSSSGEGKTEGKETTRKSKRKSKRKKK